jgi:hypothetical protein
VTLNKANSHLTRLIVASASSTLLGYLADILRAALSQYEKSDLHIPLGIALMENHPTLIAWELVCHLLTRGVWVEGSVIDWVVLCGGADNPMPSIDFIPTHVALYAETLSGSREKNQTYNAGVLARLQRLVERSNMPTNLDPQIKHTTTAILFPFNPSGAHWVLVHAQATTPPNITFYDSTHGPGQYKPPPPRPLSSCTSFVC